GPRPSGVRGLDPDVGESGGLRADGDGGRPQGPAGLENAARVVALEVLAAAQGLEFLKPLRAGLGPRAALAFVRSAVPPLDEDRSLAGDANRILEWLATGQFLEAAEKAAGRLA